MTSWPETLPAPLSDSFKETLPDTVIRSSMDQGPGKARRRTTAGVGGLSLNYILNRAGVETLEGFFGDALAGGALSFSFAHPRNGNLLTCRFRQPPAYVALNASYCRVSIELEVLP